jgi:putative transposase
LLNYPPKVAFSKLANSLKGVSSRILRQQHPDLVRRYWKGVLWSPSYFAASCGGAPLAIIKQYIDNQKTPDKPTAAPVGGLYPALKTTGLYSAFGKT